VLVVLGFWIQAGQFQGLEALVRGGVFWATLRIHVVVMLYVAIAGITQGVAWYRAARARELHFARLESQLARARLEALNAQIRPHFLFNTLHTIGQLWRSGRSDEADGLLDHLGSLFQRVQSTSAHAEVPLEEELDMVGEYLAIEEARFRDRLRVEIDATPEARRAPVPPLILQPLVENAIRHGISRTSTAGRVDVRARVEAGTLELLVEDDGPGANGAPAPGGSGTGLRNTRERLEQLYGPAASIETSSPPGGGFRVRVRLPAEGSARP
jgi:sensor histidine kinase YesM